MTLDFRLRCNRLAPTLDKIETVQKLPLPALETKKLSGMGGSDFLFIHPYFYSLHENPTRRKP